MLRCPMGRSWRRRARLSFEGLENIGIDETSYKKGHKYMTVVMNHDTNAAVWAGAGHGKAVLSRFFELLTEEQRASIRRVSADAHLMDCLLRGGMLPKRRKVR